jgi:hypothetical protein
MSVLTPMIVLKGLGELGFICLYVKLMNIFYRRLVVAKPEETKEEQVKEELKEQDTPATPPPAKSEPTTREEIVQLYKNQIQEKNRFIEKLTRDKDNFPTQGKLIDVAIDNERKQIQWLQKNVMPMRRRY